MYEIWYIYIYKFVFTIPHSIGNIIIYVDSFETAPL